MRDRRRALSGILIMLLVLTSGLFVGCGNSNAIKAQRIMEYNEQKYDDLEASGELVDGVRVIEVHMSQFDFDPGTIVVNQGERIRLIVYADDVPHGFEIEGYTIPGYDVDTKIRPGLPMEIEFVAEEKGVWEIVCTIFCGFGHSVMKGTFIIR